MEETIGSEERYFLEYAGRAERTVEFWKEAFRARDDMKLAWAVWYGIIRLEKGEYVDYAEIEERYARYWGVDRRVEDDIAWTEKELALLRLSPVYKHYTVLPDVREVVKMQGWPGLRCSLVGLGSSGWKPMQLTLTDAAIGAARFYLQMDEQDGQFFATQATRNFDFLFAERVRV